MTVGLSMGHHVIVPLKFKEDLLPGINPFEYTLILSLTHIDTHTQTLSNTHT